MLTDSESEFIGLVIAKNKSMPGALLPILHGIQDAVGYIPADAVGEIASALNLSRAEVHGVITYYHHFRSDPAGRTVVQICRAESCQAMGSEALWQHACSKLGISHGERHGRGHGTTADGAFTLEPVYCLGLCASSPAMAVNEKVHARMGSEKFDRIMARAGTAERSPA
ncbi:MAG: formate dehydrogenase subunit gamma [Comamonadaceae bacterium]|nr:MAG: formate dehydrogenase subunit gamma [Comamonadaceae bacterium]